jgi:hypothetical protein
MEAEKRKNNITGSTQHPWEISVKEFFRKKAVQCMIRPEYLLTGCAPVYPILSDVLVLLRYFQGCSGR